MVWISTVIGHASNQRRFRNDISEHDRERLIKIERQIEEEDPLSREDFPTEIFGAPDVRESDYRLPDFWFGYGYRVVSAAAAGVLRQFDLGNGSLYPVSVLEKDRQTPIGEG